LNFQWLGRPNHVYFLNGFWFVKDDPVMPLPPTDMNCTLVDFVGRRSSSAMPSCPELAQTVHSYVNKNLSHFSVGFATSVASRYRYEVLQMVTPTAFMGFTCHFLDNGIRAHVLASHELFHKTHPSCCGQQSGPQLFAKRPHYS
jgi:hypothetical protein